MYHIVILCASHVPYTYLLRSCIEYKTEPVSSMLFPMTVSDSCRNVLSWMEDWIPECSYILKQCNVVDHQENQELIYPWVSRKMLYTLLCHMCNRQHWHLAVLHTWERHCERFWLQILGSGSDFTGIAPSLPLVQFFKKEVRPHCSLQRQSVSVPLKMQERSIFAPIDVTGEVKRHPILRNPVSRNWDVVWKWTGICIGKGETRVTNTHSWMYRALL